MSIFLDYQQLRLDFRLFQNLHQVQATDSREETLEPRSIHFKGTRHIRDSKTTEASQSDNEDSEVAGELQTGKCREATYAESANLQRDHQKSR